MSLFRNCLFKVKFFEPTIRKTIADSIQNAKPRIFVNPKEKY